MNDGGRQEFGIQQNLPITQVLDIPSFAHATHFVEPSLSAKVASGLATSHAGLMEATSSAMVLTPFLSTELQVPNEERALLFAHYFHTVCAIFSCFDSFANPFRAGMETLLTTSPLIQSCVLSMSAAHLRNTDPHWSVDGLRYLTATLSELTREINIINTDSSLSNLVDRKRDHALLGIIILGVTTSWHDSAGLGLEHIRGSRALFRTWIERKIRDRQLVDLDYSQLHFYLGMQAYWEAMASFLIDQEMNQLDYLIDAFKTVPAPPLYIHPWTGISAIPWLCLAKAGCIIRLHRNLEDRGLSIQHANSNDAAKEKSLQWLTQEAHTLIDQVLSYAVPQDSQIRETYDEHTPKSHLVDVAHCCRLAALLELYRAFDTLHERSKILDLIGAKVESQATRPADTEEHPALLRTYLVRDLSLHILRTLSGMPIESGTRSLHHLFIVIAGGALLPHIWSNAPTDSSTTVDGDSPLSPLQFWRLFVLDRISSLERFINLDGIRKLRLLLKAVWALGDTLSESNPRPQMNPSAGWLHWVDIMESTGLQFFL